MPLEELSLQQLLSEEDLCLEELLEVPHVDGRIKTDTGLFLRHCNRHEEYGDRLISLGLKCPMHQSNSPQMRRFSRIAADLLTNEHPELARLMIRPTVAPEKREGD